jgi:hypothetical protein
MSLSPHRGSWASCTGGRNPYDALMRSLTAPPFDTAGAARDFYFLLMVYLRELKRPGEPVGLHQYLLAQALHHHDAKYDVPECRTCQTAYPCLTVLSVALLARFPAPWTPRGLAATLSAGGVAGLAVDGDVISFGGGDTEIRLQRDDAGSWAGERRERGDVTAMALADDAAMCEFLRQAVRAFPTGLATAVAGEEIDLVRPGVGPARAWWSEHVALPYLVNRLQDGVEATGPEFGDLPPQFTRLTAEDAAAAGQRAAWAIPAGHPLHGQALQALARCTRCHLVSLFSKGRGFCLIHFDPAGTATELPRPRFEEFGDYPAAYAAMYDHYETCDWRPRYPGGWSQRYPKPPRHREPGG